MQLGINCLGLFLLHKQTAQRSSLQNWQLKQSSHGYFLSWHLLIILVTCVGCRVTRKMSHVTFIRFGCGYAALGIICGYCVVKSAVFILLLKFDFWRFFFRLGNLKIFRFSHTCTCGKESAIEAFDVGIEVPNAVVISLTLNRNAVLSAFQRIL